MLDGTKAEIPQTGFEMIFAFKRTVVIPVFLFLFFSSCDNPFAPVLSDGDRNASAILTDQSTPEEVLVNFAYAYNFKDSLVYADLLDSSFIFFFTDFSTDPPTPNSWGRDKDLRQTVKLFRNFHTINLIWGESIFPHFTNDDSTEKQIEKTFTLTLVGSGLDVLTGRGSAVFNFRKKIRNLPDTKAVWKIIRWEDKSSF